MTTCTVYRTWIKRGQLNWVTKLPYIRGVQLVYGQNIREQQTDGLFKSNANISIKNVLRVVSGQAYYFSRTFEYWERAYQNKTMSKQNINIFENE